MITFLAPDLDARGRHPGTVVSALPTLVEAAYSRCPEHAAAKAAVVALNLQSRQIATSMAAALPEELREFWEAYSGWFAMYSVGPLLLNQEIARQAIAGVPPGNARIIEDWRRRGWWSGREDLQAAMAAPLAAAGWSVQTHPGAWLHALRPPVALHLARQQGTRELDRLAAALTQTPPPAQTADVLWASLGASAVDLIARLESALHERGLSALTLDFDYFGSLEALQRSGLPHLAQRDFLRRDDVTRERAWLRHLDWGAIARALPPVTGFSPAQEAALADRLRLVIFRDAALWRLRSLAAHRALDALTPQVVVGFHVYGPPMAPMVIAARRRGVPRVCLQHGVIGPRYLALPCLPFDEKLVFGDYARDIMQQAAPELRLTTTGHALYDAGMAPVEPRPEVLALREGVRGLVVLCTQFNEHLYHDADRWWMQGVADACRDMGVRLALKLHPSDAPRTLELYRKLLRAGDDLVVEIPHGTLPLNELLAASDLMVTRDSTVVFEADLLDKPVMTVNLSPWDEELPYAGTGGALGVYRYEDIAPALDSLLNDAGVRAGLAATRASFLRQHTGPSDGQATARIADVIGAWARGSRPSATATPLPAPVRSP